MEAQPADPIDPVKVDRLARYLQGQWFMFGVTVPAEHALRVAREWFMADSQLPAEPEEKQFGFSIVHPNGNLIYELTYTRNPGVYFNVTKVSYETEG
jgi:hypothetical protein